MAYDPLKSPPPGRGLGQRTVVVVGAGVVGIACAIHLQRDGHRVTVIDRVAPGESCSRGNAGLIAPGSCLPQSMPGVLPKVPGWLCDPLGPLSIRWTHLPVMAPWLVRFAMAGRPGRAAETTRALRALIASSTELHLALAASAGAQNLVRAEPYLKVYESEAAFREDARERTLLAAQGVEMEILDGDRLSRLEPALAPEFRHGVWLPGYGYCLDPHRYVRVLADRFAADGGTVTRGEARGFEVDRRGSLRVRRDGGDLEADTLVVAAGAWSGRLAAMLGSRVPLEAERGYHVTVADSAITPRRAVMAAERKFIATPMECGLRFAGTAEFAGLTAPPNYQRARILLRLGRRMFPGMNGSEVTEWMGHRPATPDSLPVIGPSPRWPSVFFAFGHGHLGLTGAPITGRLIADMVSGRPPRLDVAPYRVDRF